MNKGTKLAIKFMSSHMKKYVEETNFWYASGGYYKWVDADGQIHQMSGMKKEYIKNCINKVEEDIKFLKGQFYDSQLKENFKIDIKKIDSKKELKGLKIKIDDEAIECIKEELIEFLEYKKEELEEYI